MAHSNQCGAQKAVDKAEFDRPWGVAFDSTGDVYVTDLRNNRIQKFDNNGKFLDEWGKEGNGPGEFIHLHAIAIDPSDNIYLSDAREHSSMDSLMPQDIAIDRYDNIFISDIGDAHPVTCIIIMIIKNRGFFVI